MYRCTKHRGCCVSATRSRISSRVGEQPTASDTANVLVRHLILTAPAPNYPEICSTVSADVSGPPRFRTRSTENARSGALGVAIALINPPRERDDFEYFQPLVIDLITRPLATHNYVNSGSLSRDRRRRFAIIERRCARFSGIDARIATWNIHGRTLAREYTCREIVRMLSNTARGSRCLHDDSPLSSREGRRLEVFIPARGGRTGETEVTRGWKHMAAGPVHILCAKSSSRQETRVPSDAG